eukprot:TRINITY_DN6008_c0_g1_i1.p1 TRINITY_DN6008_c0_g1~~TRINITY_DN6008_c0_g1_i1.p1  ORF type:complete len:333 (+),score=47.91 TRINITY_DN6008_c0_g1_i1:129-1127(+)
MCIRDRFYFKANNVTIMTHTINHHEDMYLVTSGSTEGDVEDVSFRLKQQDWMRSYRARTGQSWLGHYGRQGPRGAALHKFWITAQSEINSRIHVPHPNPQSGINSGTHTHADPIEMVVLSVAPKVLLIPNLLSLHQVNHIIKLASPNLRSSTIGAGSVAHQDTSRRSQTAWLTPSSSSELSDEIYPRLAALFPCILDEHTCAEDMQIVRYSQPGDQYRNHFDFFETGTPRNRFATLLIYLNDPISPSSDPTAGGTEFNKGFNGSGLTARPPAGGALLFYNMLKDGNGDRLSEHAGMPIPPGGDKWIANIWIWDPTFDENAPGVAGRLPKQDL